KQLKKSATIVLKFDNFSVLDSDKELVDKSNVDTTDDPIYRFSLVNAIINMAKSQNYAFVSDFNALLVTLKELALFSQVGNVDSIIADAIKDVTIRVPIIRRFSISMLSSLISDCALLETSASPQKFSLLSIPSPMIETLASAIFLIGEYAPGNMASHDQTQMITHLFQLFYTFEFINNSIREQIFISQTKLLISVFGEFLNSIQNSGSLDSNAAIDLTFNFGQFLESVDTQIQKMGFLEKPLTSSTNLCLQSREMGLFVWVFLVIKSKFLEFKSQSNRTSDSPSEKIENPLVENTNVFASTPDFDNPFSINSNIQDSTISEEDQPEIQKFDPAKVNIFELFEVLKSLFLSFELRPMSFDAQLKVQPLEDLFLCDNFDEFENFVPNPLADLLSFYKVETISDKTYDGRKESDYKTKKSRFKNVDVDRRYYLDFPDKKYSGKGSDIKNTYNSSSDEYDDIPVVTLDIGIGSENSKSLEPQKLAENEAVLVSSNEQQVTAGQGLKENVVIEKDETGDFDIEVENELKETKNQDKEDLVLQNQVEFSSLAPVVNSALVKKKDFSLLAIEFKGRVKSKYINSVQLIMGYKNNEFGTQRGGKNVDISKIFTKEEKFLGIQSVNFELDLIVPVVKKGLILTVKVEKFKSKDSSYEMQIEIPVLSGFLHSKTKFSKDGKDSENTPGLAETKMFVDYQYKRELGAETRYPAGIEIVDVITSIKRMILAFTGIYLVESKQNEEYEKDLIFSGHGVSVLPKSVTTQELDNVKSHSQGCRGQNDQIKDNMVIGNNQDLVGKGLNKQEIVICCNLKLYNNNLGNENNSDNNKLGTRYTDSQASLKDARYDMKLELGSNNEQWVNNIADSMAAFFL
ncbi:hypothetical protein BB560_001765, partial [Smittium megazygosporum]